MQESDWTGCYKGGWSKHDLVGEAFSHPAKGAKGLAFRIAKHCFDEGWLHPGDTVIDPFFGVGCFALPLLLRGVNVVGIELESRFCALAQQNIALWNSRYKGKMPRWGEAVVLCGDSRQLLAWGRFGPGVECVISSPAYAETELSGGKTKNGQGYTQGQRCLNTYGSSPANLGNMKADEAGFQASLCVSSPPYCDAQAHPSLGSVNKDDWGHDGRDIVSRRGKTAEYGDSPAQLAAMKAGSLEAAIRTPDCLISSPPYCEGLGHGGTPTRGGNRGDDTNLDAMQMGYGDSPAQLAAMKSGSLEAAIHTPDCVISSPPWEQNLASSGNEKSLPPHDTKKRLSNKYTGPLKPNYRDVTTRPRDAMGRWPRVADSELYDNLGNSSGDSFWAASKTILQQVFVCLRPGGHAVWVCGDYIRNGKRVPFSDQWRQLCEAVGFKTLHWHRCWKTERYGVQARMDGGEDVDEVSRVSFFRRLQAKRGGETVLNEDVLCLEKPA